MAAKIKKPPGHNYNPFRHKPRNVHPRAFEKVYWPYLPLILLVSLMLAVAAQTGGLSRLVHETKSQVLSYSANMSDSALLLATNAQRANVNLADLTLNGKLDRAAQAKVKDMTKRNYWSHNTPSGRTPWTFVIAQNYNFQKLGENLAAGFSDSSAVVNAWLASPTHRQNLLDPAYTSVGFGYANKDNYTAAGGGPMTVVVAFYGQAPDERRASTPAPTSDHPPATTETPTSGSALADRTTRAELAFAKSPLAPIATSVAAIGLLGAICTWLGRHFIALRRAWQKGEKFVIKHPALDLFLLAVAILSFILSQTAGFIQ